MIILTIMCPTTPDRAQMFTALRYNVAMQIAYMMNVHPTLGEIEFIYDDSKRFLDGGLSIGKKREALLKRAEGKYCCYLDSDDHISPNYVEILVRLCCKNQDVVTFRNISKFDNYWTVVDMSLLNAFNEDATPDKIVRRMPFHICPVRTKYAKLYDFEDSNYGEDFSWMSKVLSHCETEAKTDAILHEYNHSSKTSESDKITRHELDKETIQKEGTRV